MMRLALWDRAGVRVVELSGAAPAVFRFQTQVPLGCPLQAAKAEQLVVHGMYSLCTQRPTPVDERSSLLHCSIGRWLFQASPMWEHVMRFSHGANIYLCSRAK